VVLLRRRDDLDDDGRPAFAFALAVALLSNPHLFVHDAAMWTIPLLLYTSAARDVGRDWLPFACFALAWPMLFAIGGAVDVKVPSLTWIDPRLWVLVAATIAIAAGSRPVRALEAAPVVPRRQPRSPEPCPHVP